MIEAAAEAQQAFNHSGVPGVQAEEDQPAVFFVGDPLVVDQCGLEIDQALQQGHVLILPLDGVGKKEVDLFFLKQRDRDFLYRHDHVGRPQVLRYDGPCGPVFFVLEDADAGGLGDELQPVIKSQVPQVGRNQGHASLPLVFVFPTNSDDKTHEETC